MTEPIATARPRGLVLRGQVWAGGDAPVLPDGVVVVDSAGAVARLGQATEVDIPPELPAYGGAQCWVGPGLVDAHVHLAFGAAELALASGVVAVRDLGAPPAEAARWRAASGAVGQPVIAVAGPLLTAPGGYPSRGWGAGGFARFLADPASARAAVGELAGSAGAEIDVIKLALEPSGGQPVPDPDTARAVVEAAHERGVAVTAHALAPAMVARALDARVDELCHVPTDPLPAPLVERVAAAGIPVVSTLHTHAGARRPAGSRTEPPPVLATAAALHRAGVPLRYGTDLGNADTRPGAEPRELALLAQAGPGPLGALRAATAGAASSPGLRGRITGRLEPGRPAYAVVLPGDPVADPQLWRRPLAVVTPAGVVSAPRA